MDFDIIPMQIEHIEAMCLLEAKCFSHPTGEATLQNEITKPEAVYFVAVKNGFPVGYAGMQTVLDEGYMMDVCVDPAHRREGIARKLLEALEEAGKRLSLSFITLEVRISNQPAISLYENMGYREVGIRKQYYDAPVEDARLMTFTYSKEN